MRGFVSRALHGPGAEGGAALSSRLEIRGIKPRSRRRSTCRAPVSARRGSRCRAARENDPAPGLVYQEGYRAGDCRHRRKYRGDEADAKAIARNLHSAIPGHQRVRHGDRRAPGARRARGRADSRHPDHSPISTEGLRSHGAGRESPRRPGPDPGLWRPARYFGSYIGRGRLSRPHPAAGCVSLRGQAERCAHISKWPRFYSSPRCWAYPTHPAARPWISIRRKRSGTTESTQNTPGPVQP
jgi:hypothetical protein